MIRSLTIGAPRVTVVVWCEICFAMTARYVGHISKLYSAIVLPLVSSTRYVDRSGITLFASYSDPVCMLYISTRFQNLY